MKDIKRYVCLLMATATVANCFTGCGENGSADVDAALRAQSITSQQALMPMLESPSSKETRFITCHLMSPMTSEQCACMTW